MPASPSMKMVGLVLTAVWALVFGLEVAFIVLTFGSNQGSIPLAAVGAVAALIAVGGVGAVVHAPLSRIPENTMKFAVGVMLTTFGTFWGSEGAGVDWPGHDAAIFGILAYVLALSLGLVALLRERHGRVTQAAAA